uniref:FBD domain-containing protein n=1 Tax=Steinernema glaseri TaxID=37863 RepID=A0A1I7ZF92_9BILA
MDSVPYDFVERTIRIVSSPNGYTPSNFTSLQGHWGRYAKRLFDETEHCELCVYVRHLPDLYYDLDGQSKVRIEDLLRKNHINVDEMKMYFDIDFDPEVEKTETETIQSILRRSNALTKLTLYGLPSPSSEVASLLESIPRVSDLSVESKVHDESAVSALVEKHAQQGCLRSLQFLNMAVPSSLFPAVRTFFENSKFFSFIGKFSRKNDFLEEDDFVKELASLFAASFKQRMSTLQGVDVEASQAFLEVFLEELGSAAEEWPGTLSTRLRPPQSIYAGSHINVNFR